MMSLECPAVLRVVPSKTSATKRIGLGLEIQKTKKEACPARVAEAGQENISTVHESKTHTSRRLPL
jgi:hypothetical protein